MPRLQKSFFLEITPDQFVNACSDTELQELDLLVQKELTRKKVYEEYRQTREGHKTSPTVGDLKRIEP